MYGLSIIEEYETESGQTDTYATLWFSSDLNKIADRWITFLSLEKTESLRESILNKSFWYTNYQRGTVHYIFRVFEVEEDNEINLD